MVGAARELAVALVCWRGLLAVAGVEAMGCSFDNRTLTVRDAAGSGGATTRGGGPGGPSPPGGQPDGAAPGNGAASGEAGTEETGPPVALAFAADEPLDGVPRTPLATMHVRVVDPNGKTVQAARTTVTLALASNPAGGTLLGYPIAAAIDGTATFDSVGLDRIGKGYTLSASSPGLTTAISRAFDVTVPPFTLASGIYGAMMSSVVVGKGTHTVYAATSAGVYRSTNRGGIWSLANFGIPGGGDFLVIDPKDPNTVYVTPDYTAGLIGLQFLAKTTNGGDLWRELGSGQPLQAPLAAAIDPNDPTIVYVCGRDGVIKSTTGGETWTKIGLKTDCVYLAIDPLAPTTLYAGTSVDGVYKSIDGGGNWTPVNDGLPGVEQGFAGVFATPAAVFAITKSDFLLKRSADGGMHWTALDLESQSVIYSPTAGSRVYASYGSTPYNLDGGVAISNDGGATFDMKVPIGSYVEQLAVDPDDAKQLYAATATGVFASADSGMTWGPASIGINVPKVLALAMNPIHPEIVVAGTAEAIYRTPDGAGTWTRTPVPFSVQALAFTAGDPNNAYACTDDGRVYRSHDGGATWDGGVASGGEYCRSVAAVGQRVWVACLGGGGMRRSSDGGDTWAATDLQAADIVAAAPDGIAVYAGSLTAVFRSTNSGVNWTQVYNTSVPGALLVDPRTPSTVYAGMNCQGNAGGVSRSTDGGVNWGDPVGNVCATGMVGLPGGTLMAVGQPNGPKLVTSQDGVTWTEVVQTGLQGEGLQVVASADGKTIYVGTSLGLYKTTTGGL